MTIPAPPAPPAANDWPSTCQRLDGRALARAELAPLAARALAVGQRRGRPVGLGMVLVGEHPASAIYVRNKARVAAKAGIHSKIWRLPATASEADVAAVIEQANADDAVDAFLVQLPLPPHLDPNSLMLRIRPDKDADGLHPMNVGRATLNLPGPRPCTPQGCLRLIALANVALPGKRAVVVGRSAIVGQPMATMLAQANATVTSCHAQTADLASEVGRAEVLVVATGVPGLVRGEWLAKGACVIDVGISRALDAAGNEVLSGDVHCPSAVRVAAALTPVPGGVGPMTLAMLLDNAVLLAKDHA